MKLTRVREIKSDTLEAYLDDGYLPVTVDEVVEMCDALAGFIECGKACAVFITGDPEDADFVDSFRPALLAIQECVRLGKESHNELTRLRLRA
jgi:hypothetical protein